MQIIQSNIHADHVQLIRVHLLGADNPVGTHGFSDWLRGVLRIIDCLIKELEKSAEESHQIIGLTKQISMLNV